MIYRHVRDNKWDEALNLCRTVDDSMLWGCLGVLATQAGADALDVAEEAYAMINHYDKVLYIQHIKVHRNSDSNNYDSVRQIFFL